MPERRALSSVPTTHWTQAYPSPNPRCSFTSCCHLQCSEDVTTCLTNSELSHQFTQMRSNKNKRKILNLEQFGQQTQTMLWAESRHTTENNSNMGPNYICTNPKAVSSSCLSTDSGSEMYLKNCPWEKKKNCPCNLILLLKQYKKLCTMSLKLHLHEITKVKGTQQRLGP